MSEIRVLVAGAAGRMGREVVRAVMGADGLSLVAAVDQTGVGEDPGRLAGLHPASVIITDSLSDAIAESSPDVMVDFTLPTAVMSNLRTALRAGVACIVGTSGLTGKDCDEIAKLSEERKRPVFVAPNFAIGAVLMMQFAAQAARHLDAAEIIELHHAGKADAPSGTALSTARMMSATAGSRFAGQQSSDGRPARGQAEGAIHIHSVRLPGLVAHQEVIFGGLGETLTLRHDSTSRESFMPGVLLAIRKISSLRGLTVGLEKLL